MRTRTSVGYGIVLAVLFAAAPTRAMADSFVVGTGDPIQDAANVQTAVDAGGVVSLWGSFDFSGMETGSPLRVVTVRSSVDVIGIPDGDGALPTLRGGQEAFFIDAPSADVSIEGLHLVDQTFSAIHVASVGSARIEGCRIEGVRPQFLPAQAQFVAIGIIIAGSLVPGAVVGSVEVVGNDVDVTGAATDSTLGIYGQVVTVAGVGQVDRVTIARNRVTNATGHGIDLRSLGSAAIAVIERNEVTVATSARSGEPGPPDRLITGIRCLGVGTYTIRENSVTTHHANAAGIRLQSTVGASVERNQVYLALAEETAPLGQAAGVQLIRGALANLVCRNAVHGRGWSAVSVSGPPAGTSQGNLLVRNDHAGLGATFADVDVGAGVLDTTIVGEDGLVVDSGAGTVRLSGNKHANTLPDCL